MLEANEMKELRKIGRIRGQQIRESSSIQPINEWIERRRRRREWVQHVTRIRAERFVKIGRRTARRPKRKWSDLMIG